LLASNSRNFTCKSNSEGEKLPANEREVDIAVDSDEEQEGSDEELTIGDVQRNAESTPPPKHSRDHYVYDFYQLKSKLKAQ